MNQAKKHTLSCGIVIDDCRCLGLGIFVENNKTRFVRLCVSKNPIGKYSFYASVSGMWLQAEQLDEIMLELAIIKQAISEANELIKGE